MRVSCDSSDPGYANYLGYGKHEVLLNGIVVPEAITADEERGEIVRWARDEFGEWVVDGSDLVRELVRGKVEVVSAFRERAA